MGARLSKQQKAALLHANECNKKNIKMHLRFLCSSEIKGGDSSCPYFDLSDAEPSINRLVDRGLLVRASHGMYQITTLGKIALSRLTTGNQ